MNLWERKRLFKQFREGQGTALVDLLEFEKPLLFDYLIRMTGSIGLASDTVDDVFIGLSEGGNYDFRNYAAFRICLYSTARKFNADKWNADTSKLENQSFSAHTGQISDGQSRYVAIDQSIRNLGGTQREVVILRERSEFSDEDVGRIMEIPHEGVEEIYLQGMQKIDAECSGIVQNPEEAVRKMPGHPPPQTTVAATMDLAMVMEGIKERPTGLRSPFKIGVFVFFVSLAVACYFNPELLDHLYIKPLLEWLGIY